MIEIVGEKQCRSCGQCKPVTEFSTNSKNPGGRAHQCKVCRRHISLDSYHRNKHKHAKVVRESPTAWLLPRDTRRSSEKALDLALKRWPALEPANDLYWRIGA